MLLKSEQIKGPFFDLSYTFVLDEANFFMDTQLKSNKTVGYNYPHLP